MPIEKRKVRAAASYISGVIIRERIIWFVRLRVAMVIGIASGSHRVSVHRVSQCTMQALNLQGKYMPY